MAEASLYSRVKPCLGDTKAVLSDPETLLLNRRDFHMNQVSPVQATLQTMQLAVGYPYRVLLSFLDAFAVALPAGADFNVVLTDPSLGIAAYHVWLRAGGSGKKGKVFAPKGAPKLPMKDGILGDLVRDFMGASDTRPDARPGKTRLCHFTFVLGNTKNAAQTLFAADQFVPVKKGLLLLKDYSKIDAADEREYFESKRIFVSVSYEGHAFALRL